MKAKLIARQDRPECTAKELRWWGRNPLPSSLAGVHQAQTQGVQLDEPFGIALIIDCISLERDVLFGIET